MRSMYVSLILNLIEHKLNIYWLIKRKDNDNYITNKRSHKVTTYWMSTGYPIFTVNKLVVRMKLITR